MNHAKIKNIVASGIARVLGLFYFECYMYEENLYL